jgi:hypothetical protein
MKFWGNIALALLCTAGFIGWMWKLQTGMPPTWYSVFFTAGSAAGIILFTSSAMEARK